MKSRSKTEPFLYHGSPDRGASVRLKPRRHWLLGTKMTHASSWRSPASLYTMDKDPIREGWVKWVQRGSRPMTPGKFGTYGVELHLPQAEAHRLEKPGTVYMIKKGAKRFTHLGGVEHATQKRVGSFRALRFKTVKCALNWGRVAVKIV